MILSVKNIKLGIKLKNITNENEDENEDGDENEDEDENEK